MKTTMTSPSLIEKILLWLSAVFYGVMVVFMMVKTAIQVGIKKSFRRNNIEKPSALDDPAHGIHGYLHIEDVRIHYVADGSENKPLMLFLHGFPEFWYSWRHQMKEFKDDYRVVAFDMRGYGDSDKPKGITSYTADKLLKDVKQVILALGYKSCILVAHDWGGAIAWNFGKEYPECVDKLIVMNAPPSKVMQKLVKTDKKQMKMSWYMFFFQLPFLPELMIRMQNYVFFERIFKDTKLSDEDIQAYKYTFSQPGALTPPINYYRAALQLPRPKPTDLDYSMPVLLIWGCKDMALSIAIPEQVQKENPKITVKYLENVNHFLQNENPELVNKAMKYWLSA